MDNLWILTEERPKVSVIQQIIDLYVKDFGGEIEENTGVKIIPDIENGIFAFSYTVAGISLKDIKKISILTVSGSSSFFDFLVFKQNDKPTRGSTENLLMAIEETKTSDAESRNTGVYIVIFIKDMQPHKKETNLLHAEIIKRINEIENIQYKGLKIWADQTSKLFPYGYPFSFVANQIHQYILIFRKES